MDVAQELELLDDVAAEHLLEEGVRPPDDPGGVAGALEAVDDGGHAAVVRPLACASATRVEWAIVGGREAVSAGTDWASVAGCCGLLAAFAVVCLTLARRAFGAYQAQV
jgi:hypothetical protein